MGKKLYVGNLTYNVNESDLEALFTPYGSVQSAQVIVDRDTNRSKGFGFVEMGSDAEAQAAIQGLNGHDHDGRNLTVNEAKPREDVGAAAAGAATAAGWRAVGWLWRSRRWRRSALLNFRYSAWSRSFSTGLLDRSAPSFAERVFPQLSRFSVPSNTM